MKVTVIVGTEKGGFLLRSDDGRKNWDLEGPFFKGWKVTTSARTPSGRWLAGTASFVYGAAIQASDDLKEWTQIEAGPAYPEGGIHKLNQIWTIETGGRRHYAGVDTAGIFYSEDDAATWHPVSTLNDHSTRPSWFPGNGGLCAHSILVDPNDENRIWCGISAVGVWRSDDGGDTWHAKNEGVPMVMEDKTHPDIGFCVHSLALDSDDANTIYRQDHRGAFRSRDAGDRWERIEEGLPSSFGFPIVMSRRTKTLFTFPLESDEYRMPSDGRFRVYRSNDRGDSWEMLEDDLPTEPVYAGVLRGAMDTDHLDPCGIYVGSTAGALYASADGGDTWQTLPFTLPRILSVKAYVEE